MWLFVWAVGVIGVSGEAYGQPLATVRDQALTLPRTLLDVPLVYFPTTVKDTRDDFPVLWRFGRLVHFALDGATLQLWQHPGAAETRSTNRLNMLLAQFPVRRTSATDITVDFNAGALQHLIAGQDPWDAAPDAATTALTLALPTAAPTIQHASIVQSDAAETWFTIIQEVDRLDGGAPRTTWYRYTFWRADTSTVTPLWDRPLDALGFFTNPVGQFGSSVPNEVIRRWDPAQPVTFYLSANTPARWRDAIRAGVLAWNHVMPRADYLRVADAPAGVLPGDPRYPLIQWIEDTDGLGVGMSHSHPLTGQILTGLVIIKAGWTAPALAGTASKPAATPAFRGGAADMLCTYDATAASAEGADTNLWSLDPAAQDEFAKRLLTAVIMHEIGHVLGLRHNFAGNLGSTIMDDVPTDLTALLAAPPAVDAPLPSSSIMDYLPFYDDIQMHRPGSYDTDAVNHSYATPEFSERLQPSASSLFCTDGDVGDIGDCQRFDGGAEPIAAWGTRLERLIVLYNQWIIDHAIVPVSAIPVRPQLDDSARRTVGLLRRGLGNLAQYQHGYTWPLHGAMPYERSASAATVYNRLLLPDAHYGPFVRPALAAQLRRLQQQAESNTPDAAWAQQIIINIQELISIIQ